MRVAIIVMILGLVLGLVLAWVGCEFHARVQHELHIQPPSTDADTNSVKP